MIVTIAAGKLIAKKLSTPTYFFSLLIFFALTRQKSFTFLVPPSKKKYGFGFHLVIVSLQSIIY